MLPITLMTKPQFRVRRCAAFLSVFSLAVLTAATVSAADGDGGATALPAKVSEYLKATLPPDADNFISVLGAVRNPQSVRPTDGITVSKAIDRAGGFGDFANRRKIKVWKPKDGRYFTVDVKAVLQNKPDADDPPLEAGDVVMVIDRICCFY